MKKRTKEILIGLSITVLVGIFIYFLSNGNLTRSETRSDYQIYLSNQTKYPINMTNEDFCSFILQSVGNQSTYCFNVERNIKEVLDYNCQIIIPDVWRCNLNYYRSNPTFNYLSKSGAFYYVNKK